jgi:hypothetical protein
LSAGKCAGSVNHMHRRPNCALTGANACCYRGAFLLGASGAGGSGEEPRAVTRAAGSRARA